MQTDAQPTPTKGDSEKFDAACRLLLFTRAFLKAAESKTISDETVEDYMRALDFYLERDRQGWIR